MVRPGYGEHIYIDLHITPTFHIIKKAGIDHAHMFT
jgi:hypothetical protein